MATTIGLPSLTITFQAAAQQAAELTGQVEAAALSGAQTGGGAM